MPSGHFGPELFQFLRELKTHNDRAWFEKNRARYERDVRQPLLRFISDFAGPLARVSRQIVADPRPVGGSMFRIHRDTRFSKDKSPYKTHAGSWFRHRGKAGRGPGFYLHLEPGSVFGGAGIWRPEPPTLARLRQAVAKHGAQWRKAVAARAFRQSCTLEGDALLRPPRGFSLDHPLIEDIKRKDFTAITRWSEKDALSPKFMAQMASFCRATSPFMRFLSKALDLEF